MTDTIIVQQLLSRGNGMLAASQAVAAGLHRQQLADFVKSGILERAERGIYISPGGLDDALFWCSNERKRLSTHTKPPFFCTE